MRKSSRFTALSLIAFALLNYSYTYAYDDCKEPLILGWDSWEPYQYKNSHGQLTGLDIELITQIVKTAGCEIAFENMPWKRALNLVERGDIDIAPGASKTEKRSHYAYFTNPYRAEYIALFVREGEISKYPILSLKDIKTIDFRLGVIDGVFYGSIFEKLMQKPAFSKKVNILRSNNYNAKMLIGNRIDGFLGDSVATVHQISNLGFSRKIDRHSMPAIATGDIHIMLSKKRVSLKTVERLNKSIAKLELNGTLQKITKNYPAESR